MFGFDSSKTTIRTEVVAGITTFVTMSYILAVNPDMFGQLEGMPGGAVFTATALAAIVGLLMFESVVKIDMTDYSESIPAFLCVIMMPLSYSISNGILIGMILYVALNVICGKFKKVTPVMYVLAVLFVLKFIFIKN